MTRDITERDATAAATGASATRRFQERVRTTGDLDHDRIAAIARDALESLQEVIKRHQLTYQEYDALKAWMIQISDDGEWPLFLDVFIEHAVEAVVNSDRKGSKGSILGPFYVPGAPQLGAVGVLPMREDEPGTPLDFGGSVSNISGDLLPGAIVDVWHADSVGHYSQFAPALPEWNFRGVLTTDAAGRFLARTRWPAPYQIPHDGATGKFIEAAGWHAWRPAHIHLKVSAHEHKSITTQLYFKNGEYVDTDIASAVKPELLVEPTAKADGLGYEVNYDFVLDPD